VAIDCATKDSVTFYEFPDDWALSTLSQGIAKVHQQRGLFCVENVVECMDINLILEEGEVHSDFELLKVDIEGKDYDVLRSLDFRRWKPWVILVENICPLRKTRLSPDISDYLGSHGYKEVLFDGINSFYLLNKKLELEDKLKVPANSRDFYIPYYWWDQMPVEFREKYPLHLNG
jgi:hypothetical protein